MKKMLSSLLLGLTLVAVSPVSAMETEVVAPVVSTEAVSTFNSNVKALSNAGINTSFFKKHKIALIALGTVALTAGTFALLDGYVLAHKASDEVKEGEVVKTQARDARAHFAWTKAAAGATYKYAIEPVFVTAPVAVYSKNKGMFTTKAAWKTGSEKSDKFSYKSAAINSSIIAGEALALTAAFMVGYDLCVKSENQKFIIAFIKHMMGTKKAKQS